MKYWISVAFLAFAIASASSFAQEEEGIWENENNFWTEEEAGMFETDNWAEDDFGVYDDDFTWDTEEDQAFNTWYGEADQDWEMYDDAGDAGWFDV